MRFSSLMAGGCVTEHLVRRTGVSQMKHRVRKSSRSDFAQADPPTAAPLQVAKTLDAVQKRKNVSQVA